MFNLARISSLLLFVATLAGCAEDRDPATGCFKRANTALSKGDYDAAIKEYTEAIRLAPSFAVPYCNRGSAWKGKGDFDAAIRDFSEAIRLDPRLARSYVNRGNAWYEKGDCAAAIKDFTEAIRLDSQSAIAYCCRGNARHDQGDYDAAVQDYSEFVRINPQSSTAYLNRGGACESKGDYEAAISDYTHVIQLRLAPQDPMVYVIRGNAFGKKGDFPAAIRDYTEAIRINPRLALAYKGLAWLRATCPNKGFRDGQQAVEFATKACELSNWKASSCVDVLAVAYAERGDWENAIQRQEQAIDVATDDKEKQAGRDRLELFKQHKPYRERKSPTAKLVGSFETK